MWHPWRHLRSLSSVELAWQDSDDELGCFDFECDKVTITTGMTQAERRCTLTHELIHRERGPFDPRDREREEAIVDREAARRLIDIRKLGETLAWAHDHDEAAEELWVDKPTLRARLRWLHPAERAYLKQRLAHLD